MARASAILARSSTALRPPPPSSGGGEGGRGTPRGGGWGVMGGGEAGARAAAAAAVRDARRDTATGRGEKGGVGAHNSLAPPEGGGHKSRRSTPPLRESPS